MGTKQKCQHPQEVDRRLWVTRATLTSAKVWKDASARMRDKYRHCSKRRGDSRKKTTYCVFRCPHQTLLIADNLEVNERTPSKTRRPHTPRVQGFPLMNLKDNLGKDPHSPARCPRMKASTRIFTKRRHDKKSQLSYAMRARLGPQMPNIGGKPHEATT